MEYNLEALGDDGFQKLCQAILVQRYPDLVCLPTNQPDGGRDAFAEIPDITSHKDAVSPFIVFQVKFSRDPATKNERDIISSLLETEAEKVNLLKEKGLSAYYLMTNVRGTSHLNVGSIDQVNKILSEKFGVPSFCYWRDDIERRLDSDENVKWSYPVILRGSDLLKVLFNKDDSDDGKRRNSALKAYMTQQYIVDEEVKFKQVQLQNSLLDLFTDVPIGFVVDRPESIANKSILKSVESIDEQSLINMLARNMHYASGNIVCASDVFLRDRPMSFLSRVVLERAPGQGKSTITQYICQVHRMRILVKTQDLKLIPVSHQHAQIRIPIRADLRDYAVWVSGKTPFGATSNADLPPGTTISLEAFLAAHIADTSGGFSFTVADLSAVIKNSHTMIVLDGLDEVADITVRKKVVDNVSSAARRINEQTLSLQFIVTSRPSAFANSPGFGGREWISLDLQSLNIGQIQSYAAKWMNARGLNEKQKKDFVQVMDNRLGQAHIKDLARNPMQLAILLSLISTKGLSLPDKRTSLYDSYVELFFSREAEKSDIVRDHRDLLIILHRFLAWHLQVEVELEKSSGSIEESRMRSLLRIFLENEGHNTELIDILFTGMIERVVALVSRVQGTYEFEVQPLREYFCARYLYETAPYSPAGGERTGTKPDRFKAIASNAYWLNVTRFYAGCYSSGELASLVDGVEELAQSSSLSKTSKPRELAAILLADWIFMQQPHSSRRVAAFTMHNPGRKQYVATITDPRNRDFISIPEISGKKALVEIAVQSLAQCKQADYRFSLARLIGANIGTAEAHQIWLQLDKSGISIEEWLKLLQPLYLVRHIDVSEWKVLFSRDRIATSNTLLQLGRFDVLYEDIDLCKQVIGCVIGEKISILSTSFTGLHEQAIAPIEQLTSFFSTLTFTPIFANSPDRSRYRTLRRAAHRFNRFEGNSDEGRRLENFRFRRVTDFLAQIDSLLDLNLDEWNNSLRPWNTLIDIGHSVLGDGNVWQRIAVLAAGIKSRVESGAGGENLHDDRIALALRARYARLKAGSPIWWSERLQEASNTLQTRFTMLLLLSWGTVKTIESLVDVIDRALDEMTEDQWLSFILSFKSIIMTVSFYDGRRISDKSILSFESKSERTIYCFFLRSHPSRRTDIYLKFLKEYSGFDRSILSEICDVSFSLYKSGMQSWEETGETIRSAYKRCSSIEMRSFQMMTSDKAVLTTKTAEWIRKNSDEMPIMLLRGADHVLSGEAGDNIVKVGHIALDAGWFM